MVNYKQNIVEFNDLLSRLERFKKYFLRNELFKQLLIFSMLFFSGLFVLLIAEFYLYFKPITKFFLLTLFLVPSFLGFGYIVYIFVKQRTFLYKKVDEHFLASVVTAKHLFLADKFSNLLSLASIEVSPYSNELITAGIIERSSAIKLYSFEESYPVEHLKKLFLFFGIFVFIFVTVFLLNSNRFSDAYYRLIQPTVYFSKPAPFGFNLLNSVLVVENRQDFQVRIRLTGDVIPESAKLVVNDKTFLMNRDSFGYFSYTFYNVQSDIDFQIESAGFYSPLYKLKVLKIPVFTSFKAVVKVPAYTGDSSFVLESLSDLVVPEGTRIDYFIRTDFADSMLVLENKDTLSFSLKDNELDYYRVYKNNTFYQFSLSNQDVSKRNPVDFNITVVKDLYPLIDVLKYVDSVNVYAYYFYGRISDDYGFSRVQFKYRLKGESWNYLPIQFSPGMLNQEVMHFFDFSELKSQKEVEYAFQVFDNDAVNGAKLTESAVFVFRTPDEKELLEIQEKATKAISGLTEQSQTILQDLRTSIENLAKQTSTENLDQWELKQKLEELQAQKEKLENLVKEIQEKFENKTEMEKFLEQSDEILAKQKEIQELFEKLLDEEMLKLFEELKELEKDFEPGEMNNLNEQLDNKLEDLQKELERNLEMLKRYEVEREVEQEINELNELSEMQQAAQDSIQKFKNSPELKPELIEEMEQKLREIQEQYENTIQKNQELKEPMQMQDFSEEFDSIQQNFQRQKENNKPRELKNQMEENSQNMQNLAEKMSQMMQEAQSMQLELSIEEMRQILDNIVEFSFKQEELMNEMNSVTLDNPKYISLIQEQKKLDRDFSIIQDSLLSISEQVPQIASLLKEDIKKIRDFNTQAIQHFENRMVNSGRTAQQFIMTSANNLALFLNESLESLKNMQKNASSGKSGKPQPQNGQPGFMQMKQQQQSLKQQMQQMIEDMKSGKLEKGNKEFSKRLAEILAQQEIMQQMLNQMQMNGELSPNAQKMLQEMKDLLKKNETDIVNKNITPELLNRQQEILTRMLEAENAENEREKEEKRESKSGENNSKRVVEFDWEKFNKSMFKQEFQQNQLNLQPFYKQLYEKYQTKEK